VFWNFLLAASPDNKVKTYELSVTPNHSFHRALREKAAQRRWISTFDNELISQVGKLPF